MPIERTTEILSAVSRFFDRRLLTPLVSFLKQGLTPRDLALTVALGVTLGTFPVLGSTTLFCTLAALALRLNIPAIQLINYFITPFQLALFIPFIRAGEMLFGIEPIPLDLGMIFSMLKDDPLGAIRSLWWTNMRAIVAWAIAVPPVGFLLYHMLVPLFIRLAPSATSDAPPQ